MEDEYTNRSDDELIAIVAVPPNNVVHRAAAAELHRRKKIQDAKDSSVQRQIRNMTIVILIIAAVTLFLTMLPFCQKSLKYPLFSPNVKPHQEYYQPTNPNERKQNTLGPPNTVKPIEKPSKHEKTS